VRVGVSRVSTLVTWKVIMVLCSFRQRGKCIVRSNHSRQRCSIIALDPRMDWILSTATAQSIMLMHMQVCITGELSMPRRLIVSECEVSWSCARLSFSATALSAMRVGLYPERLRAGS
jgi:hypothetical protein